MIPFTFTYSHRSCFTFRIQRNTNKPTKPKFEAVEQALDAHLPGDLPPVIKAEALHADLNNYFVISVRAPEDYAKGHIPGAINIPWRTIAKTENLQKINPSKPIVVYCYTGHTGQIATTVLNMLGYDALNLKYGIMSWTKDPNVRVQTGFSEETEAHNYDLQTGTNP